MDMLPQGWQQRINAMRASVSERLASLSVGQEHAGLRAPLVLDVAADEAAESYQSLPAAQPTRRPATATVTELSLPDICAAAQEALILGSDVLKLRDGQHGDAGDAVVVMAIQEAAERLGVAIQSSRTASELEMETALTLHDGLVCVPPRKRPVLLSLVLSLLNPLRVSYRRTMVQQLQIQMQPAPQDSADEVRTTEQDSPTPTIPPPASPPPMADVSLIDL